MLPESAHPAHSGEMQILIALIILGKLYTVTPPAIESPAPMVNGEFAQEMGGNVYAHADLAGSVLYTSQVGDYVVGFWEDSNGNLSQRTYLVSNKVIGIGMSTKDFLRAGDWLIRPWNEGEWYRLSTLWKKYHSEGGLTLMTCYPDYLPTTGRIYLQLDNIGNGMPKENQ